MMENDIVITVRHSKASSLLLSFQSHFTGSNHFVKCAFCIRLPQHSAMPGIEQEDLKTQRTAKF
jgi:hypothetical protein